MGKYLDRKQAIEQKLKDEITNAAAALAASIDAAAVYTEKERHRVMHEAVDRYNGPHRRAAKDRRGARVPAVRGTRPGRGSRHRDSTERGGAALPRRPGAEPVSHRPRHRGCGEFRPRERRSRSVAGGHHREERPRSGRGVRCGPFHPRDFGPDWRRSGPAGRSES